MPKRRDSYSSSSSSSESDRRRHRRHRPQYSNSSSSSSSLSEDEKMILHKVNHVERKFDRKDQELECKLNKKDQELERKDRHLEHKLRKLERRYCRIYKRLKWFLRRDKCLMVGGSDAFGSFESTTRQEVPPEASIVFESCEDVVNIDFVPGSTEFTIQRNGVYSYNFTGQFGQPAQLTVFVNDIPLNHTTTASNSGAHMITLHQLLQLRRGDRVSVRNHTTLVTINTQIPAAGLQEESQNIDMVIFKIAPLPEECGIPPMYCDKLEWCSDSESDSDSDVFCKPNKPTPPNPPPTQPQQTQAPKPNVQQSASQLNRNNLVQNKLAAQKGGK